MGVIAFHGPEQLVSLDGPSIFEKRIPYTAVCAFSDMCECSTCIGCSHDPRYNISDRTLSENDQMRFLAYHFNV